jgi:hypothetical protein
VKTTISQQWQSGTAEFLSRGAVVLMALVAAACARDDVTGVPSTAVVSQGRQSNEGKSSNNQFGSDLLCL